MEWDVSESLSLRPIDALSIWKMVEHAGACGLLVPISFPHSRDCATYSFIQCRLSCLLSPHSYQENHASLLLIWLVCQNSMWQRRNPYDWPCCSVSIDYLSTQFPVCIIDCVLWLYYWKRKFMIHEFVLGFKK